jgi:cytochrome c peroxidase
MQFGSYQILSDAQRKLRFRYADEVLYAIGTYLLSLQPPRNPDLASTEVLAHGERVFQREGCPTCHTPPDYTSGKLTLAAGWQPPLDHPNRSDVLPVSVGTDPGLALRTRKGTGFYKIPSLRGVWYRPRLLHDGSLASLEELFDPARRNGDYRSKGWNPPGTTTRAITGHDFGLALDRDDKATLLAFLRSL